MPAEFIRLATEKLAAIERHLMRNGFVLRHDPREVSEEKQPAEGAFLACTLWLADTYVLAGEFERHDPRQVHQPGFCCAVARHQAAGAQGLGGHQVVGAGAQHGVLKINDADYESLKSIPYSIRKSNTDLGERIFTLGYPRNDIVYGEGYLSARTGYNSDSLSYQVQISANPGNSGGPVFNNNGEIKRISQTIKNLKMD